MEELFADGSSASMGLPGEAVTKMQQQHLRERRRRSSGQGRGRRDNQRGLGAMKLSAHYSHVSQHSSCLKFFLEEKRSTFLLNLHSQDLAFEKGQNGKKKSWNCL